MCVTADIAYAGEQKPAIKISGVRPMKDWLLWVRFNTGEAKIYDFKPLLERSAFAPLKNEDVFREAYIDYGVTVWLDGEIDISPYELYNNGVAVNDAESA